MILAKRKLNIFKKYYTEEKTNKREIELIREYFDITKHNQLTLDDQTWNDLDMDKVFYKMDRSYSSLGESALYSMLRQPLSDESVLRKRDGQIDLLKDNADCRARLQYIFYNLGFDKKNRFLEMMHKEFRGNKFKSVFYSLYGIATLMSLILTFVTLKASFATILLILFLGSTYIEGNERKNVSVNGLIYLNKIIKAAE